MTILPNTTLRTAIVAAFVAASLASPMADARTRISTGKDLYEACKVLSEFSLNPQGPTPRLGLYCRQFMAGYFTSVKAATGGDEGRPNSGVPVYMPDCIMITGARSYHQLATQLVVRSEWHPELMERPPVELMQVVFGGAPVCPAN
mgnify:CR=1 FL=1|tara:strand:+ start:251645 stop:252082 length:438 start_codon:yes stop_codon:yes gene_type:complete